MAGGESLAAHIDLVLGEVQPNFVSPLNELGHQFCGWDTLRYRDPQGWLQLRGEYGNWSLSHHGSRPSPSQIAVTNGAKEAFWLACRLLVRPGDHVLLPKAHWPIAKCVLELLPCHIDYYENSAGNVSDLIEKLADEIRDVVILNSPGSPLGISLHHDLIVELKDLARCGHIRVISDEVYGFTSDGSSSFSSLVVDGCTNVLCVDSVSKSCAAAGLRIGFLVGHEDLIRKALSVKATLNSCASGPSEIAATYLLSAESVDYRQSVRKFCEDRTKTLRALLLAAGHHIHSAGSIYVCVDVPEEAAYLTVGERRVRGAPGLAFGAPGILRLCATVSDFERLCE